MLKKVLIGLGALLILALTAIIIAGLVLPTRQFEATDAGPIDGSFAMAPDAITLARTRQGALLIVHAMDERGVEATDLSASVFAELGTLPADQGIKETGEEMLAQRTRFHAWEDLDVPIEFGGQHIAAGTNFRAHAEEVGLDGEPFLFPKLSTPTPWDAPVEAVGRLDYEAELCAVTLDEEPIGEGMIGFMVCNDFTDRLDLVARLDLDLPMGQSAFPDAKGGRGRLPVGPLLVIPRDPDAFVERVTLQLSVNGEVWQRADASLMIWSPLEVLQRALEDCETDYQHADGPVRITPCDGIPRDTLLLTGTGAGVRFHLANLWNADAYMQPGDEVLTSATHLGVVRSTIH